MKGLVVLILAGTAAGQTAAAPPAAAARLAAQAEAAARGNKPAEAERLYRQAVSAAPRWEQGWWQLGTLQYEARAYAACRDSFQHLVELNAKLSRAFAFLGLCEFQTKAYGPALVHLETAYSLGLRYEEPWTRTAMYQAAVLQTHAGNFERALGYCRLLTRMKPNDPAVVAVAGIASLRLPIFPQELAEGDRDVAFKLGSAMLTGGEHPLEEATRRFDELLKEYPDRPNLHYSYAMILLANDPDRGVAALRRELAIDPKHLPALVSMGFEYLKRGDAKQALPYAERAVAVAPGNFAARGCLGRALVELGEFEKGAAELELAVKLEPGSSQLRYQLASAYAKLGRKEEAARARAEFARLKAAEDARTERDAK
ncbi:tetratricopeptide repeat protein [uncultured Paludibaculum sp.]|uniref:tetratricopeptide repeat protein n=1 Tax=uncultured Paludibaculum sp. TaxID=1765020 RepID=UPI002AAAB9C3|nr:tetratricopeptide repeat protein [uncultured Paludibaculum sp.]